MKRENFNPLIKKTMLDYLSLASAADINDAAGTDQFLISAPFAGKVQVDACHVVWTEATGSQSSTVGTVSLKVAGTEVGLMTAPVSASIGAATAFTVDGTYATAANPTVEFAAGDAILLEIGTQATGGTVTGDGTVFLAVEYGV